MSITNSNQSNRSYRRQTVKIRQSICSYRRQTVGTQRELALASEATFGWFIFYAFLLATVACTPDLALGQTAGASKPKPQMKLKNGDSQYKRIHQFALRMIELDQPESARKTLEDHLGRHPNDEESLFLMGVLNATNGKNEEAVKNWKRAIDADLPAGRIVAGPRGILNGIQDHEFVKSLRTQLAQAPIHGPILGSVTDASAMAWVRTSDETQVRMVVSESPNFTVAIAGKAVMSLAKNDYTAKPTVEGLKPATRYYYAIEIDGNLNRSDDQVFSTFPGAGRASQFKLAFGGGAGYVPPNERMWNVISKQQPDLALLLGDNVYIDDPESVAMQKYTYYRRQSRPEFRAFTAKTPTFTIWDDHDFGTNDCWGGPEIDRPAWKRDKAWTIYRQNWPNPGFGGGEEQPGCWYSFSYGDVDFVMLDCRYYRTNPRGDSPSMLGPA
ncbi:MAG: alkaline phosphatase D family protein, partial [Planctomycetota bacterium]